MEILYHLETGFWGKFVALDGFIINSCDFIVINTKCTLKVIGIIENIETIAVGGRIREIMRLRRQYGSGRWRKLKGIARVRLTNGRVRKAEVH